MVGACGTNGCWAEKQPAQAGAIQVLSEGHTRDGATKIQSRQEKKKLHTYIPTKTHRETPRGSKALEVQSESLWFL